MDVDEFWHLIEESAREAVGREARLEWLHERLVRRSAEDIIDFASWMEVARRKVDTYLMWGAARTLHLVGGLDSIWYFYSWIISLGRETFEQVTSDPDTLMDVPEVRRYNTMQRDRVRRSDEDRPEFEELGYVAVRAWEQATGGDWDALADALEARGHVLDSLPNPADEEWDLDDKQESARRLPRINRNMSELYGRA
ncbi:DUF4240 domain-containing protein [Nonomuraea sp. NPDC051191]|uniref:DUF4240 domain-containing protein n=1 Tax=Nonomuraea sp. NPDC051191 TaxID=3364372 RepID=UPI0037BC8FE9